MDVRKNYMAHIVLWFQNISYDFSIPERFGSLYQNEISPSCKLEKLLFNHN